MNFDFTTETITPDATNVLTIGGTGGLEVPVGLTATRPSAAENGTLRYNSEMQRLEAFQENGWTNYTDALHVPGSTYKTIQDFINLLGSRGTYSGGDITDNGDGTIAISGGTGQVHSIDSTLSPLYFFDFPTTPSLVLTDNALNNIFADYNNGVPQVISVAAPDFSSNRVIIGQVYRDGTTLTINNYTRLKLDNSFVGIINRFQSVSSFQRESGGLLQETGVRNFAISSGVFWEGIDRLISADKDTSTTDTFTYWYRNSPTTWVSVPGQTQIDNTRYNNPNTGLATLSNRSFGVHWIYLSANGDINVIYGTTNGNLAVTEESQPPPLPPNTLLTTALIGRIIIEKSLTTFTEVQSAFDVTFAGSTIYHNDLVGLQGGAPDAYYHVTATQFATAASLDLIPSGMIVKSADATYINRTLEAGTGILITNADGVLGNPIISTTSEVTSFSAGATGFLADRDDLGLVTLSGVLSVAHGGTGIIVPPENGQILIGNGDGYELSTITAGPGISIVNSEGSITISNTGAITGILSKSTVPITATTAAETTIFEYSIPGNTLSVDSILRLNMQGDWHNPSGFRTCTVHVYYGDIELWADSTYPFAKGSKTGWSLELNLCSADSLTEQSLTGTIVFGRSGTPKVGKAGEFGSWYFSSAGIYGSSNFNSANTGVFKVTVSFTGNNPGFTKRFHTLEQI